jgi:catechol 2,3-dioxygenase-like lactoylglutathione lyase family enzyme
MLSFPLNEFLREEEADMMESAKDTLDLGILVSDIKASLNFYQNILGLKFVEEVPALFGTLYRLRFGSSDFKLIDPKTRAPKGPIGLESQLGFRYVTFVIKNLSKLCAELQSKGIEFVVAEKEVRPGVRLAMVKDPDGNIVEFVERS